MFSPSNGNNNVYEMVMYRLGLHVKSLGLLVTVMRICQGVDVFEICKSIQYQKSRNKKTLSERAYVSM